MERPIVELTKAEYDSLVEDQNFLRCLEAAGVDNWEGYETAVALSREEIDEDDL